MKQYVYERRFIMRKYKEVIAKRYNKQKYDWKSIINNIYAPVNPIGFYGEFKSAQILRDFVLMIASNKKDKVKMCDCGCGDGVKTRLIAEFLGNPSQVYGVEYSKNRLEHCKSMNALIHYKYADLTEYDSGIPFDIQFDGIVAFVVFMHFTTEREILNALKNIYDSLKNKGLFLWYELRADNHWEAEKKNVDCWGFSEGEMDKYASSIGFKLIKEYGVYTRVPIVNVSSGYMIKNIKNIWLLELLEKLPLKKNNIVKIYRKE